MGDDGVLTVESAAQRGAVSPSPVGATGRAAAVPIPSRWPTIDLPTHSVVWLLLWNLACAVCGVLFGSSAFLGGWLSPLFSGFSRLDDARRAGAKTAASRRAAGAPPWEADGWSHERTDVRDASQRGLHAGLTALCVGPVVIGGLIVLGEFWTRSGVVFASLASVAVCVLALLAFARYQQGGVQVRYTQVPYVPGTRATFFVAMTAGGSRLRDTRLVLRCWGPRTGRTPGIVWSQELNPHEDASPGPDEFVEVAFDIPAGLPSNAPHGKKPVHWHLVVAGRTNWGKVVEFMPVPVYDVAVAASDATGGAR